MRLSASMCIVTDHRGGNRLRPKPAPTCRSSSRTNSCRDRHGPLNWDDLRFSLLAAQAKTLAGAARAGGVQHTTIGRRLVALERSLCVLLFLRGPEGLTLTPMGEQLLPLAQKAGHDILALRDFVASRRNRVRLALPSGFIALFVDELARLAQEHPDLTLETVNSSQVADLQRGDADLALRVGPIQHQDLVTRSLGEVGSSLYAASRNLQAHPTPINLSDLSDHRLVAFGAELSAMPAARWLQVHAGQAAVVLRTNEM
jgi:DNA-binding transcriptional LysR family regulator